MIEPDKWASPPLLERLLPALERLLLCDNERKKRRKWKNSIVFAGFPLTHVLLFSHDFFSYAGQLADELELVA